MKERIFVISDIHLSPPPMPAMMRHPSELARFIGGLRQRCDADERVHLMIAGDFVDYLPTPPYEPLTRDPTLAAEKLRKALGGDNACVVEALNKAMKGGVSVTVMAGNHDLEWAHPSVQRAFVDLIGASPEFVVHGEAWRRGGLLIEHGNRYDGANENDWNGMRALVSSQSRGETLHAQDRYHFGDLVRPSAGSQMVVEVLNHIRDRYPFVPLLQPEGVLTALLLRVLEPSLRVDWNKVVTTIGAQQAAQRTAPSAVRNIAATSDPSSAELRRLFPDEYPPLVNRSPVRNVSRAKWRRLFLSARPDSVAGALRRKEALPRGSLKKLQVLLRHLHRDEAAFAEDGDTGPFGNAAKLMVGRDGIQTVVMGHTHLARRVGTGPVATYINSGTWTDMVRVPPAAMLDSEEGLDALEVFLGQLCRDEPASRSFEPCFAEVRIVDGVVTESRLARAS